MFAKLYNDTEHGQILVMLDTNEDDEPVIKYFCQPEGLGVCCAQSPVLPNSEEGWCIAEQIFAEETEKSAVDLIGVTIISALEDMEIIEIPYAKQQQKLRPTYH